jgi:hypothetical protein
MSDQYGGPGKAGGEYDPNRKPGEFSDDPDLREDKTEYKKHGHDPACPNNSHPLSGETCDATCFPEPDPDHPPASNDATCATGKDEYKR